VQEKAPDLLLRAFRQLPGCMQLVVAGGSSYTDSYVEELHRAASEDPRVLFPGYVYGSLLEALYAHAAAFVLPSQLEGLPLTLLEAASHGVPIVASAIAPHVEVLRGDGPGHRLFLANDEGALVRAIERSLADPTIERRGARRLRDDVLRRYDWDRAASATERVYLGLPQEIDLRDERDDRDLIDLRDVVIDAPLVEGADT